MDHVVIIGNGITGITAARNIRKGSTGRITVISSETDHFFSRTALMYIYMGHLTYDDTKPYEDWFWDKNAITRINGHVTAIEPSKKQVILESGENVPYDKLVIATGSKSNKFGWPGQDLPGVQGLFSYPDLQLMEENTAGISQAVIVGGGLIGIEMAEMLQARGIQVTMLVREALFWNTVLPDDESKLIGKHIEEHHIDLRLETELKEILSDDNGRVRAVITSRGETIECEFVGLTVGVSPNIDWLKESLVETDRGVLINDYFETSVPDVYAGGDCAQHINPPPGRRPVEQVWYTGKMHGEHIAACINDQKQAYNPGVWFNSAKFLDIEYQTYGEVLSKLPEDQRTLYWEHSSGKLSFRVNYRADTGQVIGFNLFGLRGRHSVCEYWISSKMSIRTVLENLGAMNFDPEFFSAFETDIIDAYNKDCPDTPVVLKTQKGLFSTYIAELFRNFQTGAAKK